MCKRILLMFCLVTGLFAPLHASTIRLADGIADTPELFDTLTVEGGARQAADSTHYGLRITLPAYRDTLALFVEASRMDGELDGIVRNRSVDHSGRVEGIGLYYTKLPDWYGLRPLVRFAYHSENTDVDNTLAVSSQQATVERNLRSQSLAIILSPRGQWLDNGLNAYVGFGLAYRRYRRDLLIDTILEPRLSEAENQWRGTLAAGLVYPWKRARLYVAADYEEALSASLGIRWLLGRKARQQ